MNENTNTNSYSTALKESPRKKQLTWNVQENTKQPTRIDLFLPTSQTLSSPSSTSSNLSSPRSIQHHRSFEPTNRTETLQTLLLSNKYNGAGVPIKPILLKRKRPRTVSIPNGKTGEDLSTMTQSIEVDKNLLLTSSKEHFTDHEFIFTSSTSSSQFDDYTSQFVAEIVDPYQMVKRRTWQKHTSTEEHSAQVTSKHDSDERKAPLGIRAKFFNGANRVFVVGNKRLEQEMQRRNLEPNSSVVFTPRGIMDLLELKKQKEERQNSQDIQKKDLEVPPLSFDQATDEFGTTNPYNDYFVVSTRSSIQSKTTPKQTKPYSAPSELFAPMPPLTSSPRTKQSQEKQFRKFQVKWSTPNDYKEPLDNDHFYFKPSPKNEKKRLLEQQLKFVKVNKISFPSNNQIASISNRRVYKTQKTDLKGSINFESVKNAKKIDHDDLHELEETTKPAVPKPVKQEEFVLKILQQPATDSLLFSDLSARRQKVANFSHKPFDDYHDSPRNSSSHQFKDASKFSNRIEDLRIVASQHFKITSI